MSPLSYLLWKSTVSTREICIRRADRRVQPRATQTNNSKWGTTLSLLCKFLNSVFILIATYALLSAAFAAYPAKPADPHYMFQQALEEYKAGRATSAYGKFMTLADAGDPEAARIALIMLRHGPEMYGTAWGASQPQIDHWILLAQKPMERIIAESGD